MCSAAAFGASKPQENKAEKSKLELTSSFKDGQPLSPIHSWKAENVPPTLTWSHIPEGTKSFVLIMDDPDAPDPKVPGKTKTWVHWVVFNIPATVTGITESLGRKRTLPDGTTQGINDFGKIGYDGPYPPVGKAHRYFFKLYALDSMLKLSAGSTKEDVEAAMEGHTLGSAQIMGTYARKADEKKKK